MQFYYKIKLDIVLNYIETMVGDASPTYPLYPFVDCIESISKYNNEKPKTK